MQKAILGTGFPSYPHTHDRFLKYTNSRDLDLGLHCLPMSHKKNARLIRAN